MKKLITILAVMIVLVGAAFATDAVLTLNSTIPVTKPTFTIGGAVVATPSTVPASYTTTTSSTTLETGKNIAEENLNVAIVVFQNNKSFYKNVSGFDLTVTATKLILTGKTDQNATADEKTADPIIVENSAVAGDDVEHGDHIVDFHPTVSSATGTVVTYHVTYPTGKKVTGAAALDDSDAIIGKAVFQWAANDELIQGTYTGTITLSYTAN